MGWIIKIYQQELEDLGYKKDGKEYVLKLDHKQKKLLIVNDYLSLSPIFTFNLEDKADEIIALAK